MKLAMAFTRVQTTRLTNGKTQGDLHQANQFNRIVGVQSYKSRKADVAARATLHLDDGATDHAESHTTSASEIKPELENRLTRDSNEESGEVSDTLSLLAVSGLWATYSPALRYMYMLPGPPSPAALTASRALLQAVSLWPLAVTGRPIQNSSVTPANTLSPQSLSSPFWRAGIELGLLNFAGTAFQAVGLESTSATRGSFLVHSTAIFTPLLDGLTGGTISATVWLATALGAIGAGLFTVGQTNDVAGSLSATSLGGGDVAVLAAAFCYSLTTIRIGKFAQQLQPIQLAFAKSLGLATLSAGWLVYVAASSALAGHALSCQWEGFSNPTAWATLLLMAAAGATAAFLQTKGQRTVPPARAQVLFSMTPLWSTLFAVTILHEDVLSTPELAGGALIIFASLLAARPT